jgi:hypothetical protein
VPPEWLQSLRQEQRHRVLRWLPQVLFLAVLVGGAYARGHWRAQETLGLHARAAACMYGAATQSVAANSVENPSGYYAAMFLDRSADWPSRCEPLLRELARDPANLTFPSVKAAEADVQKAAQIVLSEIDGFPREQGAVDTVPLRPLWGLEMLRMAVTAYADSAGVEMSTSAASAAFSAPRRVAPTPTWLDLDAATDATIQAWGSASDLSFAAFDHRGLSYLRLTPAETKRARLPKVRTLSSVVRRDEGEYLVWTAAFERCGSNHCAGKSLGLAPMPVPLLKVPEPRWVAAHPFGSPSRSLTWHGNRMWMAAANLDGTPMLVEFEYKAAPAEKSKDIEPLAPIRKKLGNARDLVVFTEHSGELGALALELEVDSQWELAHYRDGRDRQALMALPRSWKSGWVRTCSPKQAGAANIRYFVVGNAGQVILGYAREGVVRTWSGLDVAMPEPSTTDRDVRVAVACTDGGSISVAFVRDDNALESVTCSVDEVACRRQSLSDYATSVDATFTSEGMLVAFSGAPARPQLRLEHLDMRGMATTEASVPGPCWERWGGMCGDPVFTWAGERLILAARSGSSLMALESVDTGQTWSELSATNLVKPPAPHILPRVPPR